MTSTVAAIARMVPAGSGREPGSPFGPVVAGSTDDPWRATLHHLGRG